MKPVTQQQKKLSVMALSGFFFILKIVTIGFFVLVLTLILSQSAVAPISSRLLSAYALEYATKTIKPYRHYFPQPYMVNLEE